MKKLLIGLLTLVTLSVSAQDLYTLGEIDGINIGGLEFWPFDDAISTSPYPDRIIWNFNAGASKEVEACFLKANKKLVSWLRKPEGLVYKELHEIKALGGKADFYMWTNDYLKAPLMTATARKARVWHWNPSTRPDGGWLKFESTLMPNGICLTPDLAETEKYLQTIIEKLKTPTP